MKALKATLKNNDYIKLIIAKRRIVYQNQLKKCDDYKFINYEYKKRTGRILDIENPKRFTEKLQWLKLFYRDDRMPQCADKACFVDYLRRYGYSSLAIETYGYWESPDEIPLDQLPEQFILKATHGSSMHLVIRDKNKVNWKLWTCIMKTWLKTNIAIDGREWHYNYIKPQIKAEKLLFHENELGGTDYKFFCFNGIPYYIQVDSNLLTNHCVDFFDIDWNHLELFWQFSNSDTLPAKTMLLDKMIHIAKVLSKPFPHVRVDFLAIGTDLYITELTFFDGSGFYNFHPDRYDFEFGNKLQLPEANYNIELLSKIRRRI